MALVNVNKRLQGLPLKDELHRASAMDRGETPKREGIWVFEISWEVVNKIGGIHTVMRTKASVTTEELGDQYCMIGPYSEEAVKSEVEILEPDSMLMWHAISQMRRQGLKVIYGRWLIDGYPKVVLFDVNSACWRLDLWKNEFWNICHIGIPNNDREAEDAIRFGFMVAIFIQKFRESIVKYSPLIVTHFHEWMGGVGLIVLRAWKVDVATIFTTHATLLGRFLCAGGSDVYNNLNKFDINKETGERGIHHKYCMERATVHSAHIFTTVSGITGVEAEHLLKRKPDIITPNGLNVIKFSALHELQNMHSVAKERIHDFVRGHFHGHYNFDVDKTLYFFTAGRYEFSNKGGDLFIESLARLNHYLKSSPDPLCKDVTVVAFIIYPANTKSFNKESLHGQVVAKHLHETVDKVRDNIGNRMYELYLRGHIPNMDNLVLPTERVELKRCMLAMKGKSLPPICTHTMSDDENDPVLCALRRCHLHNKPDDRVKVIFHPEFLSTVGKLRLIALDYEEFVRGCNLGVFPSYYEPWGYTPAECTAMGVPSVSTNLSGFGCFIQEHVNDPDIYGIYIIDRRFRSPENTVQQLAQKLYDFCCMSRRQRVATRNRTERLSELLDWKNLGIFYQEARHMALMKAYPDRMRKNVERVLKVGRPASIPSSSDSNISSDAIER